MDQNRKKLITTESKRFLFFIAMLAVGSVLILGYMAVTGNSFQKFTDVILEYTSLHASNKSAERNMFFIFSIAGVLIYAAYYFASQKGGTISMAADRAAEENGREKEHYIIVAILVFAGMYFFVYRGVLWLLFAAVIVSFISLFRKRISAVSSAAFVFVNAYALFGLYRIYAFLGGSRSLSLNTSAVIVLTASIVLSVLGIKYRDIFERGILISQLLVPFTLLIYVSSDYLYRGEIKHIRLPFKAHILIILLIALFIFEAVVLIRKYWRSSDIELKNIVSYGMCISILAFNRFNGSGSIMSTDLHHPFENTIGFFQIFEFGKKAFEDYIPVSGMYSVIQGAFWQFFGKGQVSYYFLTQNIFYLVIIIITVFLLKKQMRQEWVLFLCLAFYIVDYNRVALILPIMLLLSWPALIERKNLWLKAWYLTSFIHALYYPVFGAAVCIGFLPLGIRQIRSYAASGELLSDIKKPFFWIWWIVCTIPVILGIPYLLGTVKHMRAMGGQTIFADGLTRFGQLIPDNFLPYTSNMTIRLVCYYLFTFMILISIVWASAALSLKLGRFYIEGRRIRVEEPVPAYIAASVGLTLLVSFSYTVIRMDVYSVLARSTGVVMACFAILILITERYLKGTKLRTFVLIFAVALIGAISAEILSPASQINFTSCYTVPDSYVYVENDQVERFGTCFVEQGTYDTIEDTYNSVKGLDREDSYLGIVSDFGLYYLCGLKGDSVMETGTIKGFSAVKESVDLIRKEGTAVGPVSSVNNYYFYNWLISSGEYVWSDEKRLFEPNDGKLTRAMIREQNKDITLSLDGAFLGRAPGSWGASLGSLRKIFSSVEADPSLERQSDVLKVDLGRAVNGSDADFMYLEFADTDRNFDYTLFSITDSIVQNTEGTGFLKYLMKKDYNRGYTVAVYWNGEDGNTYSMNCDLSHGKLLIPLGSGRCWLLNDHTELSIALLNENGETVRVPEIADIEFLKLREVE